MKDRIGVEIKPGDYVAYAVTSGRSGCLHIGRVLEITSKEDKWRKGEFIEKAKIEILEYYSAEDSNWRESYYKRIGKEYKPSVTNIQFPERIVVVNHYVPKQKEEPVPTE